MSRELIVLKIYSGFSAVSKVSNEQEDYGEDTVSMWAGSGLDLDAGGEGRDGKI